MGFSRCGPDGFLALAEGGWRVDKRNAHGGLGGFQSATKFVAVKCNREVAKDAKERQGTQRTSKLLYRSKAWVEAPRPGGRPKCAKAASLSSSFASTSRPSRVRGRISMRRAGY